MSFCHRFCYFLHFISDLILEKAKFTVLRSFVMPELNKPTLIVGYEVNFVGKKAFLVLELAGKPV